MHQNTSGYTWINYPPQPAPCPTCGRCPTCGKIGLHPPYPWTIPSGPYWGTVTYTSAEEEEDNGD